MSASMPDGPAVAADRRSPFCFQTHEALGAIRARFSGARLQTAITIYVTLTELANRAGGAAARDGFSATRKDIAEMSGCSAETFDRYAKKLVEAGVLEVEARKVQGVHLPNLWVLVDAPGAPGTRTGEGTGSRARAATSTSSKEEKQRSGANAPPAVVFSEPPPVELIDGQNLVWNAVADGCAIPRNDPNRRKEIAAALNGGPNVPVGIRTLAWSEFVAAGFEGSEEEARETVVGNAASFEEGLVRLVNRRIGLYRVKMPGATLTPTALAKWWLSLEDAPGGGMSPEQAAAYAARVEADLG